MTNYLDCAQETLSRNGTTLAACVGTLIGGEDFFVVRGRMSIENLSALLGTAAGFCTTVSFVPQIIKIWKQGGRDVSYGMLTLFLVGVLLWFGYGVVVKAQAVIITNLATAVLIAIAMGLKAWTAKRDFGKTVMGMES
jgi:MtN3 and saliva related transmembrane protein